MPAFAALSLYDGASTPVAHTFSPDSLESGVASYKERTGGVAIGFPTATHSLRGPAANSANRIYKVSGKVRVPSVNTVDGVASVAYSNEADFSFRLSELSTQQQRDDLASLVVSLINSVPVRAAIENLETTY